MERPAPDRPSTLRATRRRSAAIRTPRTSRQGINALAEPRPRVALVTQAFPLVSETFVVHLFERLVDRGWDVHVVTSSSDAGQWRFFPEAGARKDLRSRIHVTADVNRALRSLRPALVHFQFGHMALGRLGTCRELRAKSIVSFRGFDICFHRLEEPRVYREVWDQADLIHLVSHDLWERARQRGCPPTKPHAVIVDAIDPEVFDPGRRAFTDVVGTLQRPFRILSVGRLVWKKGHELGLAAVRRLIDQGLHCELRIVGDGEHRPAIAYAIRDLGLDDVVRLLGARPAADVRAQMRWADALLHPSLSEGFAVSVVEAQAMTLPVVCSDAEGLPENVADGETGFVVPKRDAAALADKLALLAVDPALRERLGTAGRDRASRFTLSAQIEAFERLYRDVVDVRGRTLALSAALLAEPIAGQPGDEALLAQLDDAFGNRIAAIG